MQLVTRKKRSENYEVFDFLFSFHLHASAAILGLMTLHAIAQIMPNSDVHKILFKNIR